MKSGREQEERRRGEETRRGEEKEDEKEEDEEEEDEEDEEEDEEEATDIKSNNPHLAGGEQRRTNARFIPNAQEPTSVKASIVSSVSHQRSERTCCA